ncbi:YcnI family protein [Paucibacter sp. APW11]|uniref:YcnI family protein n=1 Tax=Roseateles aquae TaxID=3077235 RepID=A0ABU3PH18_9BURK|nr:YcnI family protein [Paucibacter sp. APW11]MDT9001402.1 YcnI family protein [Paucibacter sp. APW11]
MTPIQHLLTFGLAALLGHAQAHVTLEQGEAIAGSPYKAVFKVGHGCDGSATTRISVQLPAGFRGAKPQPKPGWTLAIRKDKLTTPYESHGKTISEDVVELVWTASSEASYLQDAWYDEFVLRGSLPETPGPLWFKVRQSCQQGEWFWAEQPASGSSTKGLKAPAVLLMLKKPEAAGEHQH